jgi:lipopolysaccharide/colanic/teichoic acid biosynthesis glycosyltransferase
LEQTVDPQSRASIAVPDYWRSSEIVLIDELALPLAIPVAHDPWTYQVSKRALDLVFATVGLVILSPVFLIAALLILASSPGGPILFRQTRLGRGGTTFTCLKFRTMIRDAEDRKADLLDQNECIGPVFKIQNDPRVTALGRWLRSTSIDELPQLLNVLRGQMSLVGPRPPLPSEVAHYTAYQLGRLAVKPGLTCVWQVSGRSLIQFEQWVELDLAYIRNRSFATDCRLILQTILAVLRRRGAY